MKKTIGLIIILIIMLITLTGCAEVNYEIEINEDGSGEITYIYGVEKGKIGGAEDLVEQFVGTFKEQAEESGYKVEVYENQEISGFKANKHLNDLEKEFSLEEAFGEEYVKDTENNKIKIEKNFWTTRYSQNTELDLTKLNDTNIEMTYKIKIPIEAKTSNASETIGNVLTWNLKSGKINKIEFVAEKINMLPIAIISAVAVVIIVITVIIIKTRKKHVTKIEN
mgnify:CR=1 FL=1